MIRGAALSSVLVAILAHPAVGGSLVEVRLTPDGSAEPPGDRIDVVVLFDEGESRAVVEAHPMILGAKEGAAAPAAAPAVAPAVDRAGGSPLVVRADVARAPGAPLARVSLVVPYERLDLPAGRHMLGYEARLVVGSRVEQVVATRATVVFVDEGERTEMLVRRLAAGGEGEATATTLFELGATPREGVIRLPAPEVETVTRVAVRIPGKYVRHELETPRDGSEPPPVAVRSDAVADAEARTVHFATNRAPVDGGGFSEVPGDEIRYGRANVSVPVRKHRRGQLERSGGALNWWRGTSGDPRVDYFLVEDLEQIPSQVLGEDLREGDVLLYIHGFKNSFEDAILRTAQIKLDLEFPGHALAFTWPSDAARGEALSDAYRRVETLVPAASAVLGELLELLRSRGTTGEVHVIAHSLGCRVLLEAVHERSRDVDTGKPRMRFGHVVLAAADVDWPTFATQAPSLLRSTRKVTYYYSTRDMPLAMSKSLHGDRPPIGLCPLLHPGVDTINADAVNQLSYSLGHSYYSASNPLLDDLMLTIVRGLTPGDRQPPLGNEQQVAGFRHWEFAQTPE